MAAGGDIGQGERSKRPALPPLGREPLVGRYRLVRRLGAGASGEVWLGRHVLTDGVAAVKLLHPTAANRAALRRFFAREGRAVARLDHPHIVALFAIGDDYLVTAFIDGGDLGRRLASPLDPHLALRMARQIASALDHAHHRRVVHRDIKPANILIDQRDNAYVADFGIARLLDDDDAHVGDRAGTPAFMAPEQRRGEPPSPAADQYALGRTLIQMLAGAPLPPDAPAALDLVAAWVPPALRAALARATAEAPGERFASMAELAAALSAVSLAGLTAPPRRLPLVRPTAPFAWCTAASRLVTVAPDVQRADFTLAAARPKLPADAADALLRATGLASFGWSVYGHVERLGLLADPDAAARARAVVVLAHGFLGNRLAWHAVAPALCRDRGDVLVLAPDLHGAGETRFASAAPPRAQLTPRALGDGLFAWLDLLGLRGLPAVLVGHSFAGHALLALADDELDARTVRVAVTPYVNDARNNRRARVLTTILRAARHSRRSWHAVCEAYVRHRRDRDAVAPEFVARMREELARADPLLTIRGLESLAGSRIAAGRLERCFVLFGENDPFLPRGHVPGVVARYGIPPRNARWIASGGHYPFFDSLRAPEAVARNREELVRTIEEALEAAASGTASDTRWSFARGNAPTQGRM